MIPTPPSAEAAFILGRALHLVEDMAQPQHALNEAHYPYTTWHWIPVGGFYNPSFLENFSEAHISNLQGVPTTPSEDFCPGEANVPDYSLLVSGLDSFGFGCDYCTDPLDYFADAARHSDDQREPAGQQFSINDLRAWFPGQVGSVAGSYDLPFQFVDKPCDTKNYRSGRDFRWNDFVTASIRSIDFGYRLKEAQSGAAGFASWHTNALLRPAVADAAGVIVAFWNEVKDVKPNPKPCDPPKPARESPDDSAQVKSSVVATNSAMPASSDWHNICRVGIGKGLPTMADYGVSSSLFDQIAALDPNTDPSVANALYSKLEAFETKYSGPQNMMPQEAEEAPLVAVWEKGFGGSARSLLESFQEPVKMLEEPQEPVFTDEQSLAALPLVTVIALV